MERIPLYRVHMPKDVMSVLEEVLFSGYIAQGPKSDEFEKRFGEWVGNPNTVLTSSCTGALALSVRQALDSGEPTEKPNVVSTPMTCIATNTPIREAGAAIKWADVEEDTGNISAASIDETIDEDTRAIMLVHWSGMPADLDAIHRVAQKHGVPVVEDSAHALGALYKSKKIGNHSEYACFSFQAIKHITTIEGGAVACKKPEDAERITKLRWFGLNRKEQRDSIKGFEEYTGAGYKMNTNDVSSAIGLEQLKYLDGIVTRHKENAKTLKSELDGTVGFPRVADGADPSYWILTILVEPDKKRAISDSLSAQGIDNSVSHTRNDIYKGLGNEALGDDSAVARFDARKLNIPCGWWLTQDDLQRIANATKEAVKNA